MRAEDLLKKNGELSHKLRNVRDLVRHINTREKGISNYSVFLGAGASVTSGIQSATTLIEQWYEELYETICGEKPQSI